MKLLQYYKQLSFMVGWCGLLPLCTYAQDAVLPAGNLRWDYSDSRVARSVDGRDLNIEFAIKPVVKLKTQEVVCILPVTFRQTGKKA